MQKFDSFITSLMIRRFDHFEQIADVQMLAMLSCVLSEQSILTTPPLISDEDRQHAPTAYFPTLEVASNLLRPPSPKVPDRDKQLSGPQSMSSSLGGTTSDPITPFPTGVTPPTHGRSFVSFEKDHSQVPSVSKSPEQYRSSHRSNSNLASTFAASFSRPFSFSTSISSSPPGTYGRKRMSPAGSYAGASTAGVTWGATSLFRKPSNITEGLKPVYAPSVSDTEEDIAVPKAPVFATRLKNQDQFDNEAYANVSLLDPEQSWRYHAYREMYAHMLLIWNMPIARCEILKYNEIPQSFSNFLAKPVVGFSDSLGVIRRPSPGSVTGTANADLGLAFRTHYASSMLETPQQHRSQQNFNSARPESPLICGFCAEIVRGLSSPCLACGHVLHTSCRSEILSQIGELSAGGECVTGCGCRCVDHLVVKVEVPPLSQNILSTTFMKDLSLAPVGRRWEEEGAEDEDVWEDVTRPDVAYESLARVRERYITPKPSQIWRGGEDRKDPRLAITRDKL